MKIQLCPECDGTQKVRHEGFGGDYACVYCNGFGVRSRSRHSGYANTKTAQRALETRKGFTCRECKGIGRIPYPEFTHCYRCHNGVILTELHTGDVVDEVVDRTGSIPREVWATLRDEFAWEVEYLDGKALPHIVTLLGVPGAIMTCTDYGTAYRNRDPRKLVAEVKERESGPQLCNVMHKETRRVTSKIKIWVTANGYVVIADHAAVTIDA